MNSMKPLVMEFPNDSVAATVASAADNITAQRFFRNK